MNIYVGNLAWGSTDEDLRAAFEAFGEVASAKVIMDRESGRSRGFGFVEMSDDNAAGQAIEGMNGKDLQGRTLRVNEARPRENRRSHGPRR
jgi:RNA recognition motif-containing protein